MMCPTCLIECEYVCPSCTEAVKSAWHLTEDAKQFAKKCREEKNDNIEKE